jgi:hypothetical protein
MVEGDLRRDVSINIKRLMDLGAYVACAIAAASGPRPAHAHNARTRKGKAKPTRVRRSNRVATNLSILVAPAGRFEPSQSHPVPSAWHHGRA